MPVLRVVGALALTDAGDYLEGIPITIGRYLHRVGIVVLGAVWFHLVDIGKDEILERAVHPALEVHVVHQGECGLIS